MRFFPTVALGCIGLVAGLGARIAQIPTAEQLVHELDHTWKRQDFDVAERRLVELVRRYPDEIGVRHRLALAKLANDNEQYAKVIWALEPVPDSAENAATVRVAEGDAWRKLFRASKAEHCWSRALKLDPQSNAARRGLLYLYSTQLRREEWLQSLWYFYDQGVAGQRELIQLLIAGEVIWEANSMLDEAATYAAADPEDVHSRRALAIYLFRAGRTEEAIDLFQRVHQQFPGDQETTLAYLNAVVTVGDEETAQALLNSLSGTAEDDYQYWKQLGTLQLQRQQHQEAAKSYQKSVSLFPYDLEVRNKLAQALRFTDQTNVADRHAEVAQHLSMIQRLCHTIDTNGWDDLKVIQLIEHCLAVGLNEEAAGWIDLARLRAPANQRIQQLHEKIQTLPTTSSRNPPTSEMSVETLVR